MKKMSFLSGPQVNREYDNVAACFEAQVLSSPQARAVIDNDFILSYLELNGYANKLANYLQVEYGIRPLDKVAILLERSALTIISQLAVAKLGAVYVPLNPSLPAVQISQRLKTSAAKMIIGLDSMQTHGGIWETLPRLTLEGNDKKSLAFLENYDECTITVATLADSPLYMMFTSGTSGIAKGVLIPQRAVLRLVRYTEEIALKETDTVAHLSNIAFDASTYEIWGPLLNGASLCIIDDDELLDIHRLAKRIADYAITVMWQTSGLFDQISAAAPLLYSPIRLLLVGGDVVNPQSVKRLFDAGSPPQTIINGYGPTENTTFSTLHRINAADLNAESIPIGRPIANTQVLIVGEHMNLLPEGEIGELCVAGDGLALGYAADKSLTARQFVTVFLTEYALPLHLYKTGDFACIENGLVLFAGRKDEQVKIRGYRVELNAITTVACTYPGVQQALAVSKKHQEESKIVLYIKGTEKSPRLPKELKEFLNAELAHHEVPDFIIGVDEFPINENGKIDRKALPDPFGDKDQAADEEAAAKASLSATELAVKKIFQSVTGAKDVLTEDDFFYDLGGNSLASIKVIAQVQAALGVKIALSDFRQHATVRSLADLIEETYLVEEF